MNNDIIKEMDLVIDKIKSSSEYTNYINILEQVNKSNDIKVLTDEIRKIQKDLIKIPSIKLEELLKVKKEELNNIPLYLDYKDKLEVLNNMLLLIKDKCDIYINTLLIDEI